MIEAGLQQLLSANANVSAIVATRIYPMLLPDSATYPAVTYQRVSTVTSPTFDSTSDLVQARIQFDAYGLSYSQVKSLAHALLSTLENFAGTLPSGDRVANIWLDSQQDLFEDAARIFRVSSDLMVLFYQ